MFMYLEGYLCNVQLPSECLASLYMLLYEMEMASVMSQATRPVRFPANICTLRENWYIPI